MTARRIEERTDQASVDLGAPLIIGFGVVGRALASALVERGHRPVVVEDRPTDQARRLATDLGVELVEQPTSERLGGVVAAATVLLPSPGVPDHHPVFDLVAGSGLPIRSEFDLARLWDDRPIVAITGTNGKTSVTMLVTESLRRSGMGAAAVGNTEVPLVAALTDPEVEVFVVEASSFRLGHSHRFTPRVATWLNFAPDHLDAHASLEAYEAAKAKLWLDLGPDAVVVANADDPVVAGHVPDGSDVAWFSLTDRSATWHVADAALVGPDGPLMAVDDLVRTQPHDLANALAGAATALAGGATTEGVVDALRSFTGLPHRLQLVAERDGVRWYDDSKATVPQATVAAVGGFGSVVLIAGGRNKGLALDDLATTVPPVHHVVAIGDAADEVRAVLADRVPVVIAADMAEAVSLAASVAGPGDAVLLSPGCTSFDWYRSYGERGDDFTRLVQAGPAR
jgi:UDP-N-acetylmuramoylalanine--D-glutamate ligase